MKKIISILLAVIMAFSVMPLTALADDVQISSDSVFETENIGITTGPDYSAYDSIVKLVDAIDEKEYTAESIQKVKASVEPRSSLRTQAQINAAVTKIATAYAELEKISFTIDFVIVNSSDEEEIQSYTYTYGEEFTLSVDNGENPYKWIVSDDFSDKKIDSANTEITFVAESNAMIIVYTDTKPEEKHKLQQVKFLSFNGKLVHVVYTEDPSEVEMPEAPALPFYYFTEWVKLNDNTYQAKYLSDSICDGDHHKFTAMVAKPGCETVGYVIYQCSCGEAYSTDYCRPTGHNYSDESNYCINGCGKQRPLSDEELEHSTPNEPSAPSEPTTNPAEPEKDTQYGFDEGGYNNVVIAP